MRKCIVSVLLACFCTLVSQNAMASDLGFKSLGVSVGMVSPEDLDATFGAGVFMNHGFMTPEIKLESRIDYWSKSEDLGFGEVSVSDIAVGARGKYMFPTSGRVLPFAGAGLGLHFLSAKVDVPPLFPGDPGMTVEDSEMRLGVDIGGGLEMPMNPKTDFVAEAWYGIVSDFSQFSLRVGMAWRLGQ